MPFLLRNHELAVVEEDQTIRTGTLHWLYITFTQRYAQHRTRLETPDNTPVPPYKDQALADLRAESQEEGRREGAQLTESIDRDQEHDYPPTRTAFADSIRTCLLRLVLRRGISTLFALEAGVLARLAFEREGDQEKNQRNETGQIQYLSIF